MKGEVPNIEERMLSYLLECGFDKRTALEILNEYAEYIWRNAQKDANILRMRKFKPLNQPMCTNTPYKKLIK